MRPTVISLFAALCLAACGPDLCDADNGSATCPAPTVAGASTPKPATGASRAAITSPRDPASGLPTGK